MFYCDQCAVKNSWCETVAKSVGKCEICGERRECNDRPSKLLPRPQKPKLEHVLENKVIYDAD